MFLLKDINDDRKEGFKRFHRSRIKSQNAKRMGIPSSYRAFFLGERNINITGVLSSQIAGKGLKVLELMLEIDRISLCHSRSSGYFTAHLEDLYVKIENIDGNYGNR